MLILNGFKAKFKFNLAFSITILLWLAEQFNVNRVTIIKSIELLESESFIFTKEGSGTYVNDYLNNHSTFNNWAQSMEWLH